MDRKVARQTKERKIERVGEIDEGGTERQADREGKWDGRKGEEKIGLQNNVRVIVSKQKCYKGKGEIKYVREKRPYAYNAY